jgi:hypothetical protein
VEIPPARAGALNLLLLLLLLLQEMILNTRIIRMKTPKIEETDLIRIKTIKEKHLDQLLKPIPTQLERQVYE